MQKKVALITGAGKGIGRSIAEKLANEGIHVIINYNSSVENARTVENAIECLGGTSELYQCDIRDYIQTKKMIEYLIDKYEKIDILVNNAGIVKDNLIVKMSREDFQDVLETNLLSVYNLSKVVVKYMSKHKSGVIINIASISGIIGIEGQTNYSASKAGVIGFTKALAREVAGQNIRVNAVAPGFISTEMTKDININRKEKIINKIPMRRFGTTTEVAELVAFLSSDKATYITGHTICVDGGLAM